jgi:hypothetical protein
MDPHEPARQSHPPALSDLELRWSTLMLTFEEACQDVLASLYVHESERTQQALDALMRAELRRSMALNEMLDFLDGMDDIGNVT